jgi:hypothetical protein
VMFCHTVDEKYVIEDFANSGKIVDRWLWVNRILFINT